MASTSTDTTKKVSAWRKIADFLEFMDQDPAERRFRALEARLEALEQSGNKG